jgi:hypothetical protein
MASLSPLPVPCQSRSSLERKEAKKAPSKPPAGRLVKEKEEEEEEEEVRARHS